MQVGLRLGLALGIGAAGGVALGALSEEPEGTGSALSRVAVGASAAGLAAGYIMRSGTRPGYFSIGSAMLGALLTGFGMTHLARGGSSSSATQLPPAQLPPAQLPESQPATGTTTAERTGDTDPASGLPEGEVTVYGPDGEWLGSEHGTFGDPRTGTSAGE